jgi:hypothetical protein
VSPLHIRPNATIPIPWGAAATFAAVMYLVRSLLRGWDFRPDILDLVVFGALALLLVSRALVKRQPEDDAKDDGQGDPGNGARSE